MPVKCEAMNVPPTARVILLVVAIIAFIGPNGLYLYYASTEPELNREAMSNPVALAFMIEAMMLLALFLWYVYQRTRSVLQLVLYLVLTFAGSLAFSLPLFLYLNSRHKSTS